jgi:hypothetical protein
MDCSHSRDAGRAFMQKCEREENEGSGDGQQAGAEQ